MGSTFFVAEQDFIARVIATTGLWEPHLYAFARILVNENSNIVDLGANFGYHTIGLSRLAKNGTVFAFEPQGFIFAQLQLNIIANSVDNVKAYKLAAASSSLNIVELDPLESTMGEDGAVNLGNTGIGSGGDLCLTVKLDQMNLPKIDFLKVDIQGAESAAIVGMSGIIARDRPVFFIEIEEKHLRRFSTSSKDLIESFLVRDYSLIRIKTDWPTDHLAIPNERGDLIARCLKQQEYQTELISGRAVTLQFENRYFYDTFTVD